MIKEDKVKHISEKPHLPQNPKKIGIWEVTPIKKGTRIFSETH